jgi:hypothetical protein
MVWRIRRRQSTFWDFESTERTLRVHFIGKLEHHFVSNHAEHLEITEEHPVLINYRNPWTEIYVSSKALNPGKLSVELLHSIQVVLGVWRSPSEYFNREVKLRVLLEGGLGLLFVGPEPLAAKVQEVLQESEVRFTALPSKRSEQQVKALVAGKNFVVANDFRNAD